MFFIEREEKFTKKAQKFFKKHPELIKKFKIVIKKLEENPFNSSLKIHKLQGDLKSYHSHVYHFIEI